MVFLLPGAKLAQKIDVNSALYKAIASTRGEEAAAIAAPACLAFQRLRAALIEPPNTDQVRRDIQRYLRALDYLIIENNIPSNLSVQFQWVNAFDANQHTETTDINIDRVSALFNLAVCEAFLAQSIYRHRRTEPNALKIAARHFQTSAGYFRKAADLPVPGGIRSVTPDLYPVSLKALEMSMLGNAQQVFYFIAFQAGTHPALLARFAIGARDFYINAQESCLDPDIVNTSINGYIGRPAAALAAYFEVVAQSDQAKSHHDAYEMPEQLAHLSHANRVISKAYNTSKSLDASSLASVAQLQTTLLHEIEDLSKDLVKRKEDADEENRKVYFQSPASTLTPIQSRQSVKSADVTTTLVQEELDERLLPFSKLPPPASKEFSGLVSLYSDMVANEVATVVASLNTSAADLRELMNRFEDAIETCRAKALSKAQQGLQGTSSRSLGADKEAINLVEHAKARGGNRTLRELQLQVVNMAGESKAKVQKVESILLTEEREDHELRALISSIQRPSSTELTQAYRGRLSKLQGNVRQAANADAIVADHISEHSQSIFDLEEIDIRGLTESLAGSSPIQSAYLSALVEKIYSHVHPQTLKGKEVLGKKDVIIQAIERKRALDSPREVIAALSTDNLDVDALSAVVEKEYGDSKREADNMREEMSQICSELNDAISKLRETPENDDENARAQERMKEVYRLQGAAFKFKEILSHLEQGAKFYAKEQENLETLRNDVEGYATARRTEGDDLRQQYQSGMGPQQTYYPTTSNPYHPGVSPYSSSQYPGAHHSTPNHTYSSHQPPYPYSGSQSAWGPTR